MEQQRDEYKGHRIELRSRATDQPSGRGRTRATGEEEDLELTIDAEPIRYGRMADGSYALHEYAFDRSDNLMDLAKKFIDYRNKVETIRRKSGDQ